jgi:hypothetical protein
MKKISCLSVLLLATAALAPGQTFEVSPIYGWARMSKKPLGSSSAQNQKDNDTSLRNGTSYGIRLTYNTRGYFGHELSYVQSRVGLRVKMQPTSDAAKQTFEDKVKVHQAGYNFLIYFMPKNERWRPFMTGGVEANQYGRPGVEGWTGIPTRDYGFNYGGGIKIKLFKYALARLDVRESVSGKPYNLAFADQTLAGGFLRQQQAAFGLAFTF